MSSNKTPGEKIAYIEATVDGLKETSAATATKMDKVSTCVTEIKGVVDNIANSTVTKAECIQKESEVASELGEIGRKVSDLHDKLTEVRETTNPRIRVPSAASKPPTPEPWYDWIKNRAGAITALLICVATFGGGFWWLASTLVAAKTALDITQAEEKKEKALLQRQLQRLGEPRIIQVPVLVYPDAGAPAHVRPRARPRPRPLPRSRRRRRSPTSQPSG